MKIAMWSGPRNLSTAMMYAFAARGDCAAWDEPFYAAYLAATGIDHPMKAAIIAENVTNPAEIAARCAGPNPGGKAHFYQKHMALHMVDGMPLDWAEGCVNVHLIRHPARVVASYAAKREHPTLADIGYTQHAELFARFPGPVIDATDIRANPEAMLQKLCAEIGLAFTPSMLSWPAGPKPFDGTWAPHWYGAIHRSAGFAGAEGPLPELGGNEAALARSAMPFYADMAARKLF
ncbi:HAD family hydrolase [Oceanicola sp. D3]|uniref:sulfotransferase-like domain-containing protein n=1 Tax=Oceanicola sp. D3 TaxID=2587163 RepID=UPI0011214833|nr:HAD family hydrolase [Oceanicola sp. D3]QDC07983.1 HAD family hydrolase [Oceanicola sp. D3]